MNPGLIVGYHGCSRRLAEHILGNTGEHLAPSDHSYEWLGRGIYCWEDSYDRAWKWAKEKQTASRNPDFEPYVIGLLFHPGNCMDLTDSLYLNILNAFAKTLNASMLQANARIPATRGKNHAYDCWLINAYHKYLQKEHKQPIDTIRAAFPEGDLLGDGRSAIHMQNHIQWAICNPACIVGYFRPMINE